MLKFSFCAATVLLYSVFAPAFSPIDVPNIYFGNRYQLKLNGNVQSIERQSYKLDERNGAKEATIDRQDYYLFHPIAQKDYKIEYDQKGKVQWLQIFKPGYSRTVDSDIKYFYNEQELERETRNSNGYLYHELHYNYAQEAGQTCVEVDEQDMNANSMTLTKFYYNNKEQLTKRASFDPSGNLKHQYTYTLDSKGNRTLEEHYSYKKLKGKIENKFNSKNQKVEELKYRKDGSLSEKLTYVYDAQGNISQVNKFLPADLVNSYFSLFYDYKYDAKNNWVECTIKKNDSTKYIITRDIQYF